MKIKSIITTCLILVMLFSDIPAFADDDGVISDNNIHAVNVLMSIGIIEEPDFGQSWSDTAVSKGDFIEMALKMTDYPNFTQDNIILPWESVASGSRYYKPYLYSYLNGWLNDDYDIGDPEDMLTFDFAQMYLLNLMGYGMYPDAVVSYKTDAAGKLVKSVTARGDDALTLNDVYTMLYNATRINSMNMDGDRFVMRDGRTVLTYYKDIYMIKGKVNATKYASLSGRTVNTNELLINNDIFTFEDESYNMLLGKNVEGYAYITDDEAKLLYLEDRTVNSADTVIEGKNFISYSGRTVTYDTQEGRQKKVTVEDPVIIYN